MEFPIEVIFILSVLSSALVWVLRRVFISKGKAVPAWVYTGLLYVISLVLAVIFYPVELPPFPPYSDLSSGLVALLAFLGELIPILSAVVGAATLIYQALLKKVLDGLGRALKKILPPPSTPGPGSDIG